MNHGVFLPVDIHRDTLRESLAEGGETLIDIKGGVPFMKIEDVFCKGPRSVAIGDHFVLESLIESSDESSDEISFFSKASFSLKDIEVSDVLL